MSTSHDMVSTRSLSNLIGQDDYRTGDRKDHTLEYLKLEGLYMGLIQLSQGLFMGLN